MSYRQKTTPSLQSEDQSFCTGFLACSLSIAPDTDKSLLLKAQPADAGHDMEVCLCRECIIESHVCTQTCAVSGISEV